MANGKFGKFITFEGVDGCGKTTQLALTSEYLASQDITHITTREPGGSPIAEKIRSLVLSEEMNIDTELVLMMVARRDHIRETILPALIGGAWVLCDRFVDSSFAYQGGGRGYSMNRIQQISNWVLDGFMPDMTFLLDIDVNEAKARLEASVSETKTRAKLDRFDSEGPEFFNRVRTAFLDLAHNDMSGRIRLIDTTNRSPYSISAEIQRYLF